MNLFDILLSIGVLGILGAFIYIGKKLQILSDLQETTRKIKVNVKVISDFLTSADNEFNHTELESYSPLQLTEEGKALIADLGFDNVVKKHRNDFFKFIDAENPKQKYDVERAAIKSVVALSNKQFMDFLKVFFYNNPNRNIRNLSPTLGIYLRNMYLEEHPEITE